MSVAVDLYAKDLLSGKRLSSAPRGNSFLLPSMSTGNPLQCFRCQKMPLSPTGNKLIRRIVVQSLSEPSLDLGNAHRLALSIVSDLIAVDFAKAEVS